MEYLHGCARMRAARVPGSLTSASAKPFTMNEKQLARFRAGKKVFESQSVRGFDNAPHPAMCDCRQCVAS